MMLLFNMHGLPLTIVLESAPSVKQTIDFQNYKEDGFFERNIHGKTEKFENC